MTDIRNDLSILTTIPNKILIKLEEKLIFCINEAVQEDVLAEKDISELDLGIGTLFIKLDPQDVKYKFVPKEVLTKTVSATINGKLNLMENTLNESLTNKIINVYKNIC